MSWTQDDLDALDDAIKSGARVVEYQDQKVEYRSLKEIKEIRAMIQEDIKPTSQQNQETYVQYVTSKGV